MGHERRYAARTDNSAFTLVELLVAICIISLLLAILAPTLSRARELTRITLCTSRLHEWGRVLNLYTANNRQKYFMFRSTDEGYWYTKLEPYYKDNDELLFCPAVRETVPGSDGWGAAREAWGPCWLDDPAFTKYGSYGINSWLSPNHPTESKFYGQFIPYENWFWKWSGRTTSEVPTFLDSNWCNSWPFDNDIPPDDLSVGWRHHTVGGVKFMGRFCIDRHLFQVCSAFADGSAKAVRLPDLWQLKWSRGFTPRQVSIPEP